MAPNDRTQSWQAAFDLIKNRGYERRDKPFKLASGQTSHDYIDGKYAVDNGQALAVMCQAMIDVAAAEGWDYNAVGGLTMGADALSHGIAILAGIDWFSVRKESKTRGREQFFEGARLRDRDDYRVLLVDDVITRGGSILDAYNKVIDARAQVVGVITMVARSDAGAHMFAELHVPYAPLVTYKDLGIEPVEVNEPAAAS